MSENKPERYLNTAEAAEVLGVHRVTLVRTKHRPDPDIYLGEKPGWKLETLVKWQEENKRHKGNNRTTGEHNG